MDTAGVVCGGLADWQARYNPSGVDGNLILTAHALIAAFPEQSFTTRITCKRTKPIAMPSGRQTPPSYRQSLTTWHHHHTSHHTNHRATNTTINVTDHPSLGKRLKGIQSPA